MREYAQAGIAACWMVDPEAQSIAAYVIRDRLGTYGLLGHFPRPTR